MTIVPILVVVALVIAAMYFLLNKKTAEEDREGVVKDILNKDAISVDFGDGRAVVVKLHGISVATEAEMLDDKIFAFMDESIRGAHVRVKVNAQQSADLVSGEVYTLAGEYVNAALVRHGFARWSVMEAGNDAALGEAQQKAKIEQIGVWNPAIIQLLEDRRKGDSSERMSDHDLANMSVDPEAQQTKEG